MRAHNVHRHVGAPDRRRVAAAAMKEWLRPQFPRLLQQEKQLLWEQIHFASEDYCDFLLAEKGITKERQNIVYIHTS